MVWGKNVKNYSRYTCIDPQGPGASVRPFVVFAIKNISLNFEANPDSLTAQVEIFTRNDAQHCNLIKLMLHCAR